MSNIFPAPDAITLEIIGENACFPINKVYCIARNYEDHAREMGADPTREEPFFFNKPRDAVNFDDNIYFHDNIVPYPPMTNDLHHEIELVIALKAGGKNIDSKMANELIYGYAIGFDLTRLDLQKEAKSMSRPWDMAKGFDQSAPTGSNHKISDIGHLTDGEITLDVNGERRQQGNLSQMIWSTSEIIAKLSRFVILRAGDLIFTGTPAGVSRLEPGDNLTGKITGLNDFSITIGQI